MHILLSVTYWGWMFLTMAKSRKRLCIRGEWFLTLNLLLSRRPGGSTGPWDRDITLPTFLSFLLLVLHYLLRSWVHLGFIPSWDRTFQALPHSQQLNLYKGMEVLQSAVIENRNRVTERSSAERMYFQGLRSQGPYTHHLLRIVFFPLCVMAKANHSSVSIRILACKSGVKFGFQEYWTQGFTNYPQASSFLHLFPLLLYPLLFLAV